MPPCWVLLRSPRLAHIRKVEHAHYSDLLGNAYAPPSGCELSGEISIEFRWGDSIGIAGKRVGHLAKLSYNEGTAFSQLLRTFRKCIILQLQDKFDVASFKK